ncbi:hypothetical protein TrRE_jg13516, partial [Triparma retinervis]
VIIIGSGASGLSCLRTLVSKGLNPHDAIILEGSRDYVGGRIRTRTEWVGKEWKDASGARGKEWRKDASGARGKEWRKDGKEWRKDGKEWKDGKDGKEWKEWKEWKDGKDKDDNQDKDDKDDNHDNHDNHIKHDDKHIKHDDKHEEENTNTTSSKHIITESGAGWVHGSGTPTSPNPILAYLPPSSFLPVFTNNVWMDPAESLLNGRAKVYAGGEEVQDKSVKKGLKQYHMLMYVLTCMVKAGYDLGEGILMSSTPVKDALEIINREGGNLGREMKLLNRSAMGLEGRSVVRVLLHCIESWMGASLSSLQMCEFGYTYNTNFRGYVEGRKGQEGRYGDVEGGHGKVRGGMGRVIEGLATKGGGGA